MEEYFLYQSDDLHPPSSSWESCLKYLFEMANRSGIQGHELTELTIQYPRINCYKEDKFIKISCKRRKIKEEAQ